MHKEWFTNFGIKTLKNELMTPFVMIWLIFNSFKAHEWSSKALNKCSSKVLIRCFLLKLAIRYKFQNNRSIGRLTKKVTMGIASMVLKIGPLEIAYKENIVIFLLCDVNRKWVLRPIFFYVYFHSMPIVFY